MPPSKHRPRKLEGETQTYNVLFPVETLNALKRFADDQNISPATFVRAAVATALSVPCSTESPSPPMDTGETNGGSYADGVVDACTKVAKNSRLALKTATGGTLGEDIAQRIEKDLIG